MRTTRTTARVAAAATGGLMIALALHATAGAAPSSNACDTRANDTYAKLLQCVSLEGVQEHLVEFQRIADESADPVYPGSRAAGTQGYEDSVDYVAGLLKDAGYDVSLSPVEFTFFAAVLRQTGPTPAQYETGPFTGTGAGEVEGNVIPVDINLTPPRASTSGCEATDFDAEAFAGPDDIALIQRGTCTFSAKAVNAEAAGAEAVIIFNQGSDPTRLPLIVGTLGGEGIVDIPVVGASFDTGEALAQPGSRALVEVKDPVQVTNYSVIAEKAGVNTDNVVMAGAHLDSVPAGPGINDNGSGSAALLETALQMANVETQNTIRFGWWAAEELGLLGSAAYVEGLSAAERERIALYMNYDMVGSPNGYLGVYDADESTFDAPVAVPDGSIAIERLYESYYTAVGQPYDDSEYSGRSDYQAFIEAGIPSGGLFTGAEVPKTGEQAQIWGGTAGQSFDPCYHQACDTVGNVDPEFLDLNSDLIAYAMLHFAQSTQSVNGVPGKEVPGRPLPAPAGPEGTFAEGGGGLAHDHDHQGDPS